MGKRRLARETVLQALYLADISSTPPADAYAGVAGSLPDLDERTAEFCRKLLDGAVLHRQECDTAIRSIADNWELGRMAAVDRNILRLAAYELLHDSETPVNVIIDEAIEIARKYSCEDSTRFINGILDKLKERRPTPKPSSATAALRADPRPGDPQCRKDCGKGQQPSRRRKKA